VLLLLLLLLAVVVIVVPFHHVDAGDPSTDTHALVVAINPLVCTNDMNVLTIMPS